MYILLLTELQQYFFVKRIIQIVHALDQMYLAIRVVYLVESVEIVQLVLTIPFPQTANNEYQQDTTKQR